MVSCTDGGGAVGTGVDVGTGVLVGVAEGVVGTGVFVGVAVGSTSVVMCTGVSWDRSMALPARSKATTHRL
jgi:hypothetical protein